MKIRLEIEGKSACSVNYRGQECFESAVKYLNSIEADEVQVYIVKDDGTKASGEFDGEGSIASASAFIVSTARTETTPSFRSNSISIREENEKTEPISLKERLEMFLKFEYKGEWFTSLEVKKQYEDTYGKISLSTVSTYLARMCRENKLIRRGNRNRREYRFKEEGNIIQSMESGLIM